MFEPTSRYFALETAILTLPDGRKVAYKRRRFIPSVDKMTTLVEHAFTQGDRLDNITARYLGEPTLFWRLCDANGVMHPRELAEVGRVIRISEPPL